MSISGISNSIAPAVAPQRKSGSQSSPNEGLKLLAALIADREKLSPLEKEAIRVSVKKIATELGEYDRAIDDNHAGKAALIKDVKAQSGRISVSRLAALRTQAEVRQEVRKVANEMKSLANGKDTPSRLSMYCLELRLDILGMRSIELNGGRRLPDATRKLFADLYYGDAWKTLSKRAKSPYE